jgi:hypothetical protein
MRIVRHLGLAITAAVFTLCTLEIAGKLPIPGADRLVSTAYAVVGRPLTPVSVAGVARRTARRCAAGVYC